MNQEKTRELIEIKNERVDDIPVIFNMLLKMDIAGQIDSSIETHGNRKGLSLGWMILIWLVFIISQHDHRMNRVQKWVEGHRTVLEFLIKHPISSTDFTDDRLADGLRYLSQTDSWQILEEKLFKHTVRVYDLELEQIRLDATTATVNHDSERSTLFKVGRTKKGTYDTQFKIMMASLDPLGLPCAVDVVAGNCSDDPLYLPTYQRLRNALSKSGLLYITDCKGAALLTRATMAENDDYYLTPLPMIGNNPQLLEEQVQRALSREVELIDIQPKLENKASDKPKSSGNQIGQGFEFVRQQETVINKDSESFVWQERVLVVRSDSYANSQAAAFGARLDRIENKLLALTPAARQGRKQYRQEAPLKEKVQAILKKENVANYFEIELQREEKVRQIRAYKDKPARTEIKVRYQVKVKRNQPAIDEAKSRLGWRLYVTNQVAEKLSLQQAVLAYRDQYLQEQQFSRLKGSLAITPLYVQRDDHALGLIRLLTIGLRGLGLFEFEVRRQLAKEAGELSGIYAGTPKRATARPTTERMLDNFGEITLNIIYIAGREGHRDLTKLTPVQL